MRFEQSDRKNNAFFIEVAQTFISKIYNKEKYT